MQTITLDSPGHFSISQTGIPTRSSGSALVRIHRVGICGTDLHAFRGRQPFLSYPRILGHELGVQIMEIDENDLDLHVGDICAIEPYLNCGECISCRRGKTNCCTILQTLGVHTDGGMREFITIPVNKLHKSDLLSLDQLALVETLGIGAHAVDRANFNLGEFVLVIGAGPIGLTVTQFAKIAGGRIIVMDVNENRLDFCRQFFGVEFTVNAQENPVEQLKAITSNDMPTVIFDATGSVRSMENAFSYVASGGKLIFVGLVQDNITLYDPEFHRKEITLFSTRNSTGNDFRRIITLVEQNKIDTNPWITHRATSDELIDAFPTWLKPDSGTIKAMMSFENR